MYRSMTRQIQVTVEPFFLEDESEPDEDRYFWAYMVEIENLGQEPVHLRGRYWQITDERGCVQEVRGPGVVGQEPVIEPGVVFEYTSGCPLSTRSGIMVGSYTMETSEGETFEVEIPAFSLDVPDDTRLMN